jgi:uncharacterized cofD-like protein
MAGTSENQARRRGHRVAALGGGHGLYASLSALRQLDCDITAIVTVADDGGSSGRIRRELPVLPPGDLRMALAALAQGGLSGRVVGGTAGLPTQGGLTGPGALGNETAGSELAWTDILQHRIGGSGALAGHPIGNLLLTGLLELRADPVAALADLAELVSAQGSVLPMSALPLDLSARVASIDPDDPVRERVIRGQSSIAATAGKVLSIELIPPDAPACPEAVRAIEQADTVVLGPGSWFTSVIPHLLVPELAAALSETSARVVIILNLEPQVGETDDFSAVDHLEVLRQHCPSLHIDAVVADSELVSQPRTLTRYATSIGARVVLAPVAATDSGARHDPTKLGHALAAAAELSRKTQRQADRAV